MKSKQVDDFRSVNEGSIDRSKNDNLSYSHAGFDGLTDQKPLDGGEQGFDQAGGSTEDQPTTRHPPPSRPQSQPVGARPATNGRAAPGAYMDAQGKPTHNPIPEALRRCDHCGQPATAANPMSPYDWQGRPDGIRLHQRCEADWFDSFRPAPPRASLDAAYQAAKQPDTVADVHQVETQPPASPDPQPWVPYSQRDIDHQRHSHEGLMAHVAEVIEEQLRNLDEAKKAKREAAAEEKQPVEPPAQPDQPVSTPAATESSINSLPPRPKGMLDGDYQRMLRVARNREALARDDATMKGRLLH
jgi:hypothetical protein